MSGNLIGNWDLVSSDNMDEVLKKLGVSFFLRKLANTLKPSLAIEIKDGVWSVTTISTFKTLAITFELNKEFDEETMDGRKFKTTVVGDEKKTTQTQRDKDGNVICVVTREINDKDEQITHITAGDVTAVRVFKRT